MSYIVQGEFSSLSFAAQGVMVSNIDPKAKRPTAQPDAEIKTDEKIARWGDDNMLPTDVLEQIEDVTLIHPILEWKARAVWRLIGLWYCGDR
jgi:hypothetical protein